MPHPKIGKARTRFFVAAYIALQIAGAKGREPKIEYCHPERSEAPAERSRRTPCLRRSLSAQTVFHPNCKPHTEIKCQQLQKLCRKGCPRGLRDPFATFAVKSFSVIYASPQNWQSPHPLLRGRIHRIANRRSQRGSGRFPCCHRGLSDLQDVCSYRRHLVNALVIVVDIFLLGSAPAC